MNYFFLLNITWLIDFFWFKGGKKKKKKNHPKTISLEMVLLFSLFTPITSLGSDPRVQLQLFIDSPEPRLQLPLSISYCLVIFFPLGWSSGILNSTNQTPVTDFTPPPPSQTSSGSKRTTLLLEAPFLTWVTANTHSVSWVLWPYCYMVSPICLPSVHWTALPWVWKQPIHPTHQSQINTPELQWKS